MKKNQFFSAILFFFLCFQAFSQSTVGVVLHEDESLDGYTFFSPFTGNKAYMVDNCGHLINEWDRGTRPGLAAYFLENGLMFRTYKTNPVGPFNSASNAGGIELIDWNNNVVWSYEINTATELSHHDAYYMSNGNVLLLVWELIYTDELIELGRDPNEIAFEGFRWSEKIVELEPVGNNDANIVWQWRINDHYIQDFDDTKLNYGSIDEHPELFNINLPDLNSSNSHSSRDWNHFNSIDYNETLDQIIISTRNSDEIWIIDHSTTTEEAASHEGGIYGKGGDLLYRWGNPAAYNRGSTGDQKLFGQHGVHWIRDGLSDAGKILLFNNGNGRPGPDFSTIEVLTPPQDSLGGYITSPIDPFGPADPDWIYGDQAGENFYSAFMSNAQRLINGNTLVMSGSNGIIFEITPEKEKVWQYVIPLNGDTPATQGGNPGNNWGFRGYKYAPNFAGFDGLDLVTGATIEIGGNPLECDLSTAILEKERDLLDLEIKFYAGDNLLEINNPKNLDLSFSIVNRNGQNVFEDSFNSSQYFEKMDFESGLYFLFIKSDSGASLVRKLAVY